MLCGPVLILMCPLLVLLTVDVVAYLVSSYARNSDALFRDTYDKATCQLSYSLKLS